MDPRHQQQPLYQQQQPLYQQQQPQSPPQTQRPQTRARAKSGFSFRSDRSGSSKDTHKRKESLQESPNEKRKNHMSATTKANPNAAINEAQPGILTTIPAVPALYVC
jgi:hypothetical protein